MFEIYIYFFIKIDGILNNSLNISLRIYQPGWGLPMFSMIKSWGTPIQKEMEGKPFWMFIPGDNVIKRCDSIVDNLCFDMIFDSIVIFELIDKYNRYYRIENHKSIVELLTNSLSKIERMINIQSCKIVCRVVPLYKIETDIFLQVLYQIFLDRYCHN